MPLVHSARASVQFLRSLQNWRGAHHQEAEGFLLQLLLMQSQHQHSVHLILQVPDDTAAFHE